MITHVPHGGLWLLLVGGFSYTFGVLFYLWHRLRYHHAVWHGFVLGGSTCHYLAVLLFRNPGRIMPRDAPIRSLWGRDMAGVSRSLDTHIYRLRMKLALQPSNGVRLSAVYTLGYRLEAI